MSDLVALDLPGGAGFVDALRAIWDTGDAAAPLDPRLPRAARDALVAALRPSRVVSSDGEQHELSGGMPVETDDALVVATSGTSGQPKGVVLTHGAVAASGFATSQRLGIDPQRHHWLACLPLAHIGGLSVVTRSIVTGTQVTVLPGFDADSVQRIGRSGDVSHVSLVATALSRIDPTLFECIVLGGSRPPEILPPNVVTTYGMTETGSGIVYDAMPLPGVELAIRSTKDPDEDTTGAGEILVRSPTLFRCYRDGGDGRVVGPDGKSDWFATGDAGALGPDGRLRVFGRIDDVITTGAEKVWPEVVERVLATHPMVADVSVWKRPDAEWGERVVAWIIPGDGVPSLDELRQLVSDAVAPWAAPKELVLVDELPRTASGKVRRRALDPPST